MKLECQRNSSEDEQHEDYAQGIPSSWHLSRGTDEQGKQRAGEPESKNLVVEIGTSCQSLGDPMDDGV